MLYDGAFLSKSMRYLHGFLCEKEFLECVSELMPLHREMSFDAHGARHALARSPLYSDILPQHGQLLGALLASHSWKDDPFYIETDAMLLVEYLRALFVHAQREFPDKDGEGNFLHDAIESMHTFDDPHRQGLEFIRSYMREFLQEQAKSAHALYLASSQTPSVHPSYGYMKLAINGLYKSYDVHPALRIAVLEHGLDPTQLLNFLNSPGGNSLDNLSTTLREALCMLRPVMVQTSWRPASLLHWEQMWRAHWHMPKNDMHWNKPWLPEFVKSMVQEYPSRLHTSLEFLAKAKDVPETTVAAFFPLPLFGSNGLDALPALVRLLPWPTAEKTDLQERFAATLQCHHPWLHDMLVLHMSLYPTKNAAVLASMSIVDGFNAMVYG